MDATFPNFSTNVLFKKIASYKSTFTSLSGFSWYFYLKGKKKLFIQSFNLSQTPCCLISASPMSTAYIHTYNISVSNYRGLIWLVPLCGGGWPLTYLAILARALVNSYQIGLSIAQKCIENL